MATSQDTIDYLLEQLSGTRNVTARKMFGEYCLYLAGKPVALICDDQLFLKDTKAARSAISKPVEHAPYPGATLHLLISADLWEDNDWLANLIRATAAQLPEPKVKKKKKAIARKSSAARTARRKG